MTAQIKAGEMVGRYRVEEHVGGGGFGDVYRAMDPLLDRSVAIKVLRDSGGKGSADLIKQSLREARAASALNHPSIVTIHDVVEQPERACIVMEWIEGSPLRALLTGEPLAPARVSHLGRQIASALARAHEAGIVHRDLKPENIMVRSDEVVKILDFGLARQHVTESGADLETLTGKGLGGTLAYMAPEQLRGEALDGGCDLFAFGIILYEMTTGSHPFFAPAPYAIMQRILNADPAPPRSLADLPSGWSELIEQLLSKDRTVRAAIATDLVRVLEGGSTAGEAAQRVKAKQIQRDAHMVGRSRELALLDRRWQDAVSGAGNFVTIAAEPGGGKTTLVQRFLDTLAAQRGGLVAVGRCSERLGSGEPYLPFLEALADLAGSPQGALVRAILRSKAPTWFMQLYLVHAALSGDIERQQRRAGAAGDLGRQPGTDAARAGRCAGGDGSQLLPLPRPGGPALVRSRHHRADRLPFEPYRDAASVDRGHLSSDRSDGSLPPLAADPARHAGAGRGTGIVPRTAQSGGRRRLHRPRVPRAPLPARLSGLDL
jgi:hypothetical protein